MEDPLRRRRLQEDSAAAVSTALRVAVPLKHLILAVLLEQSVAGVPLAHHLAAPSEDRIAVDSLGGPVPLAPSEGSLAADSVAVKIGATVGRTMRPAASPRVRGAWIHLFCYNPNLEISTCPSAPHRHPWDCTKNWNTPQFYM